MAKTTPGTSPKDDLREMLGIMQEHGFGFSLGKITSENLEAVNDLTEIEARRILEGLGKSFSIAESALGPER